VNKALIGRAVYGCAFLAVAQAAGTGAWARLSPNHLGLEKFEAETRGISERN